MRINKDKSIGRVLFIVEGGKTEFTLLRRIFCNVLGYEYFEKRRDKANFFRSRNISTSKIAVINTEESNISDICDENCYLDSVFETSETQCQSTACGSNRQGCKKNVGNYGNGSKDHSPASGVQAPGRI